MLKTEFPKKQNCLACMLVICFYSYQVHAQITSLHILGHFQLHSSSQPFSPSYADEIDTRFIGPALGFRKSNIKAYWQLEAGYFTKSVQVVDEAYDNQWGFIRFEAGPRLWKNKQETIELFLGGYLGVFSYFNSVETSSYISHPTEIRRNGVQTGWNLKLQYFLFPSLSAEINAALLSLTFYGEHRESSNPTLTPNQRESFSFTLDSQFRGVVRFGLGYHF